MRPTAGKAFLRPAQNLARSLSVAPLAFLRIAERFFLPHYELVTRRASLAVLSMASPRHFACLLEASGGLLALLSIEIRHRCPFVHRAVTHHRDGARDLGLPARIIAGGPDTSEGAVELPCRILVPGPHSRAIVAHARWV